MISKDKIKFNCIHFRGDTPCKPNKLRGKICDVCDEYESVIETGKNTGANKRTIFRPNSEKQDNILIIKLGAAGDVIRSTPLLSRYKQIYPASKIQWLTQNPDVLPRNGIDVIYDYNTENINRINNTHYQIAVNLDKEKEACELLNNVNAEKKYGFIIEDGHISATNDAAWRKLLTGLFDQYSKENTLSYQQEVFDICGFKFKGEPPLLNLNKALSDKWSSTISQKSQGRKVIGLNTGCGSRWKTRLWPEDKWVAFINLLRQKQCFPMLLGGPYENSTNLHYEKVTGAFYPGTFSIEEFIALSNSCDTVVTAVSMMMHIATALEKPLILFNNIFNKHEFELYGKGKIIEPPTGCDCFYAQQCTRAVHCMNDITPAMVFEAVEELVT